MSTVSAGVLVILLLLEKFLSLSTIEKFHAEIVFVTWLRNLSWEVKIVYLLFRENTFRKFLNLPLFYLPLTLIIVLVCHYFRRMSWPFLHARASQLIHRTLSNFFAWRQAQVSKSGSKDIWTLQNGKQHGFPCFLYLYFILFLALSYMYDLEVGHEKPSLPELKPSLSLFISKNPCYIIHSICVDFTPQRLLFFRHYTMPSAHQSWQRACGRVNVSHAC